MASSYYVRDVPANLDSNVNNKIARELWYMTLEHPSTRVMKSLPFVDSYFDVFDKSCDECHQAEQTGNSFAISKHKGKGHLELIHFDLGIPYRTPSSCGAH